MLADVCSNASSIKSMTVTQEKKYYKFKGMQLRLF